MKYTPVREDGELGKPVYVETRPVVVDPNTVAALESMAEKTAGKLSFSLPYPEDRKLLINLPGKELSFADSETGAIQIHAPARECTAMVIGDSHEASFRLTLPNSAPMELSAESREERDLIILTLSFV